MLVFIDETGDHNLVKIDYQYPVFGLGALLIDEQEYLKLDNEMKKIKKEFFGDETFIFHSMDLKRPNKAKDKRNALTLDKTERKDLYSAFDTKIVSTLSFKVVACYIRKKNMVDKYYYPTDPYHFSFENLLNRIIRYGEKINIICAEKRGVDLDAELLSEYDRLKRTGIHKFSANDVTTRTTFELKAKKDNINGLQLIDLLLSSLIRKHMGKISKMTECDIDPRLIEKKYACSPTFFPKLNK